MSKTLYLECSSGISGDMTVAALLDLGADQKKLEDTLKTLPITGFEIKINRVIKSGIDTCDFDVILEHDNHDHDMEYLHGHDGHDHDHHHDHHHDHDHDHHHDENMHEHMHDQQKTAHEHHHHEHRNLGDILSIIQASNMTKTAKDTAIKIFEIIAKAESKAHNKPVEQVHFHEVGAIDSIIDIASVAICLDDLGITDVIVTELSEGKGTIMCQHGILPIPVPAVSNIVADNDLVLHFTDINGELVTPTGAAIVAAIRTSNKLPNSFTIDKIGLGAGKREYACPGFLRAMLITQRSQIDHDMICKLESNIDDCNGESLGYVMNKLFEAGAKDVHYTPVFMKKNRPAYQLNVICTEDNCEKMEQIIFENTTTIGIRKQMMERAILKRENQVFSSSIGEITIKVCYLNDKKRIYPEYESIVKLCSKTGLSYQDIYNLVLREYHEKL